MGFVPNSLDPSVFTEHFTILSVGHQPKTVPFATGRDRELKVEESPGWEKSLPSRTKEPRAEH